MSCLPEELVTWQILPLASSKTTANKTCGGLVTTLPSELPSEFRLKTKMALALYRAFYQAQDRRPRIFRDRSNPFDYFNDEQIYDRFRFRRHHILEIVDLVADEIRLQRRQGELFLLISILSTSHFSFSGPSHTKFYEQATD